MTSLGYAPIRLAITKLFIMNPVSLRVTRNACFSLLTHTKKLLLVKLCDRTAGIVMGHRTSYEQTEMNVKIVM